MTTRIFNAIASCLHDCYRADEPLLCLENYLAHLHGDPEWPPEDIDEVGKGVRRILGIIGKEEES